MMRSNGLRALAVASVLALGACKQADNEPSLIKPGNDTTADAAPAVDGPAAALDAAKTDAKASGAAPDLVSKGNDASPAERKKACADYSQALCNKLTACMPSTIKIQYGDAAACAARYALQCEDANSTGDSGVTIASVGTCVQALGAASCEDLFYRNVAACRFSGARQNGSGCTDDAQCGSSNCKRVVSQLCGICGAFVPAGGDCSVDVDKCAPGLDCNNDGICVAPVGAGMPCSDGKPCKIGLYCKAGVCAAQSAMVGAACTPDSCDGLKGLGCGEASKKCEMIMLAKAGQPCGDGAPDFCEAGSVCAVDAAGKGVCSTVVKDGELCDANKSCLSPAECIDGTCQIPSAMVCN
jgi:hypothetical protein